MLIRRYAPPVAILLLIVFAAPVLVDVDLLSAVRYALWTLVWWAFGWSLTSRFVRDGFERLVLGGVVGIGTQLVNWAFWQVVSAPKLTVVGGVLALVGAVLLGRRVRSADRREVDASSRARTVEAEDVRPLPKSSLWLLTAGTAWLAWVFVGFSRHQSRPPGPSTMYQDLYWHLGIVAELKRSVLPTVPQAEVLGRLNYHWLSDAYMASGSLGSFTPTADVALRLWYLPVVALALAFCLVVGRRLSNTWVAGNTALVLTVIPAAIVPFAWMGSPGPSSPFVWLSPSQIFGLVFTLWATWLFVPVLRGLRPSWGYGALLVATAFVCAGSKSSILPVFLGGAVCVGILFIRRAAVRRGALVVAGVCLVGVALALPLFAGGSAGSQIRMLSSLRRSLAYRTYLDLPTPIDHGPFVMPYIATGGVFLIVLGLLVALVVQYGYAATSIALGRTWRTDPMPTFLLGSFVASLGAYLVIDHTGLSQGYFPLGALPLLALLAGWGVARTWERIGGTAPWAKLLAGFVVGGVLLLALRWASGTRVPGKDSIPGSVLVIAALGVLLVVAAVAVGRRAPVIGIGMLLGAALVFPTYTVAKNSWGQPFSTVSNTKPWTVSPEEASAALWLESHSDADDLVATNVHCRGIKAVAKCDSRAYWVSALTERRVLIESWGYTDAAQRDAGRGGRSATTQPFDDQKLYLINEWVFDEPTREGVDELKRHGVRWLFGDSRASSVSPELQRFATPVHRSGPVTIYRLD